MNNKILSLVLLLWIASTGFASYTNADNSNFWKLLGNKWEIRLLIDKVESGEALTPEEQAILDEVEARKEEMKAMYNLLQKQKNGESLTDEEQAQLTQWKLHKSHRGMHGFGKRSGFAHLTDEEKTALQSMTDAEKQEFFETKKAEMDATRETHKAVIDKLIAGTDLTAQEEATRLDMLAKFEDENNSHLKRRDNGDIIAKLLAGDELSDDEMSELEAMQEKRAEREATREAIEAILKKVRSGEELSESEQATLNENKLERKKLGRKHTHNHK